jgi:hypothetical protein
MPRPKLHRDSIELDKEIARIQRESQAEIERLQKARAEAEAAEDRRRGELLREYLAGQHGDDLRNVLEVISGPEGPRAVRASGRPRGPSDGGTGALTGEFLVQVRRGTTRVARQHEPKSPNAGVREATADSRI